MYWKDKHCGKENLILFVNLISSNGCEFDSKEEQYSLHFLDENIAATAKYLKRAIPFMNLKSKFWPNPRKNFTRISENFKSI